MSDTTPAGWYPEGSEGHERFWDGRAWTSDTRRFQPNLEAGNITAGASASASPRAPGTTRRRRVWPWVLGGTVVVVVAFVVVAVVILTSVFTFIQRASDDRSSHPSGGTSDSSGAPRGSVDDGIQLGSRGDDAIRVVTYVDYFCPFCGVFESTNGAQLADWVSSGDVVLEVRPIAILDRVSLGTEYSTRAANAAACVADSSPGSFASFNALLFARQPEENSKGLSDADLIDLAGDAGATESSGVRQCIQTQHFGGWVGAVTERAVTGPIPHSDLDAIEGTPTIIVDGIQYTGALDDPREFADFVLPGGS